MADASASHGEPDECDDDDGEAALLLSHAHAPPGPLTFSSHDMHLHVELPSSLESSTSLEDDLKRRKRRSVSYVLCFVCMGLAVGSTGPAFADITKHIHVNLSPAFVARGAGGIMGGTLGGLILQKFNTKGHAIVAAGAASTALAALLIPQARVLWQAGVALFLLDAGCGLLQQANTLIVWAQPTNRHTIWLNILNGTFGFGSLLAPLAVAAVAFMFQLNHQTAVGYASTGAAAVALASGVGLVSIDSPTQPKITTTTSSSSSPSSPTPSSTYGRQIVQVIATALALNASVGAETTFGAFAEAYVIGQQAKHPGRLANISESERDILSSAFWFSFTFGRFACAFALDRYIQRKATKGAEEIALLMQAFLALVGALMPVVAPASRAALWASALCVGAGVAGLVAGFLAQVARAMPVSGNVAAATALGTMTGVSLWQTITTALGAEHMMEIISVATGVALVIQACFVAEKLT